MMPYGDAEYYAVVWVSDGQPAFRGHSRGLPHGVTRNIVEAAMALNPGTCYAKSDISHDALLLAQAEAAKFRAAKRQRKASSNGSVK